MKSHEFKHPPFETNSFIILSSPKGTLITGWWFQIFFIFTPTWGRFPIWLVFFRCVETTNQISSPKGTLITGRWFQIFFIFTPTWGRFPIWLVFFRCVETTNQISSPKGTLITGWWFQIFFIFTPTWGRFPIWLIFFKWVGSTTNQISSPKGTLIKNESSFPPSRWTTWASPPLWHSQVLRGELTAETSQVGVGWRLGGFRCYGLGGCGKGKGEIWKSQIPGDSNRDPFFWWWKALTLREVFRDLQQQKIKRSLWITVAVICNFTTFLCLVGDCFCSFTIVNHHLTTTWRIFFFPTTLSKSETTWWF